LAITIEKPKKVKKQIRKPKKKATLVINSKKKSAPRKIKSDQPKPNEIL
jgi:hypothetical protein